MDADEHNLDQLIQQGENLVLEFKSDRKSLPDRDLVAAVVALANTEGGDLLLGVEDNGTITGLHANHRNLSALPALIANKTDLNFLKMVVEQEDKLGTMPIDSLIILSRLREERRLTTADLAPSIQKSEVNVRSTLEKLVEAGFLEAHGSGRGRAYTLSAHVYQEAGQKSEYVRQVGFTAIQQEQMVLSYVDKHGTIKRAEAMDLCHLSQDQAYRLLKGLVDKGILQKKGESKSAVYSR